MCVCVCASVGACAECVRACSQREGDRQRDRGTVTLISERETDRQRNRERERRIGRREVVGWDVVADGAWDGRGADMRLAIAPGPTVHWLFRSHDLPSKLSAIASRLCDRCSSAVKHVLHFSKPIVEKLCCCFSCSSCA